MFESHKKIQFKTRAEIIQLQIEVGAMKVSAVAFCFNIFFFLIIIK